MNNSSKLLLMSALTITLCLSLIVGATFAAFSSADTTNIAVSSGKVDVYAGIADLHMYTRGDSGRVEDEWLSGQATEQNGEISLSNMAPYDGVTFNIEIASNSTVAIKWQVKFTFDGDSELYNALDVEIGGINLVESDTTRVSNWELLSPADGKQAVATLSVRIELTESAGKIAEGKNCSITVTVYAVQANAKTTDPILNFFPPKQLSNLIK